MANQADELDLTVGSIFMTRPDEDRELYEEERAWLADIQDLLREEGVEVDLLSRVGAEVWEGGIPRFADLYQLRLLAAYLDQGRDIKPILAPTFELDDEPDPLLAEIWEEKTPTNFPHLLNHQTEGGYYLPVDFEKPIWLEFETDDMDEDDDDIADRVISFGSSIALRRELADLTARLKTAGVTSKIAPTICLATLTTAAQQSVDNDLPIIIW